MTRVTGLQRRSDIFVPPATAACGNPPARDSLSAKSRREPRRISPRRIGLLGLFGCGNAGNDGSLEAMLIFLRRVRPDAELICFCQSSHSAAARISQKFGVAAKPLAIPTPRSLLLRTLDKFALQALRQLASLFRALTHARNLDLLILPGTGNLDDFQKKPLGIPLAIFGWCLAAKLCSVRIAFVSVGAGPIHHPLSRWLMKRAAAMAHYRSYRDTVSKAYMESIGFDTRGDAVYPDIAFKLPTPPSSVRHGADKKSLVVGVGVMTYKGWRSDSTSGDAIYTAYLEKITSFVLWLLDCGHSVRILMGEITDRHATADVLSKVTTARPHLPRDRLLAKPMCSLHDLMQQIAETDVVVATRFHNVVCALKLGKPTVSIGYGEKNNALMAEMGVGRFCQHIENLRLDLLVQQFTLLISNRETHARSIYNTNRIYQERLKCQDELLASHLL